MKKSCLVIVIILASILAAAALAAILVYIGVHGVSRRQPTVEEKRLLLTVAALKDYGIDVSNATACERWAAKWNLDGSLSLEYEFDSDLDPKGREPLSFDCDAEINRSIRDARESFFMSIAAYKAGMSLVGVDARDWEHPPTVADQCRVANLLKDDVPVGTMVVVRQGKVLHSLIVVGVTIADAEAVKSLLEPVLAESKKR